MRLKRQTLATLISVDESGLGYGGGLTSGGAGAPGESNPDGTSSTTAATSGEPSGRALIGRKKSKKKRSQDIRQGVYAFQIKEKRREEVLQEYKLRKEEEEDFERRRKRLKTK